MCVGHKPHPFGNYHHTIFCGINLVLWRAYIVEGKGRPEQLCRKMHLDLGRSVECTIWICNTIFSMGKSVVRDSGFYVPNCTVALVAKGVHDAALTKKLQYWIKGFPEDIINMIFAEKKV